MITPNLSAAKKASTVCLFGVLALPILLLTACQPKAKHLYAPHEAGLTLIFENPSLPERKRADERIQTRVEFSKETPEGTLIQLKVSSLKGEIFEHWRIQGHEQGNKEGADKAPKPGALVYLLGDPAKGATQAFEVLPGGFPDTVQTWQSGDVRFRFLGRAKADFPFLKLGPGADMGLWVEVESPQKERQRLFFLPNLGEVKRQVFKDGKWLEVNRLVSRGFTDGPVKN